MKNLIILDICGLLCDKYHQIDVKDEFFDFKTSKNYYIYKFCHIFTSFHKMFIKIIIFQKILQNEHGFFDPSL